MHLAIAAEENPQISLYSDLEGTLLIFADNNTLHLNAVYRQHRVRFNRQYVHNNFLIPHFLLIKMKYY